MVLMLSPNFLAQARKIREENPEHKGQVLEIRHKRTEGERVCKAEGTDEEEHIGRNKRDNERLRGLC